MQLGYHVSGRPNKDWLSLWETRFKGDWCLWSSFALNLKISDCSYHSACLSEVISCRGTCRVHEWVDLVAGLTTQEKDHREDRSQEGECGTAGQHRRRVWLVEGTRWRCPGAQDVRVLDLTGSSNASAGHILNGCRSNVQVVEDRVEVREPSRYWTCHIHHIFKNRNDSFLFFFVIRQKSMCASSEAIKSSSSFCFPRFLVAQGDKL